MKPHSQLWLVERDQFLDSTKERPARTGPIWTASNHTYQSRFCN
jgi:hypothetical protein